MKNLHSLRGSRDAWKEGGPFNVAKNWCRGLEPAVLGNKLKGLSEMLDSLCEEEEEEGGGGAR